MVGSARKKENSRAEARDRPAICPAAMVDIDREVPGKTAERIWQAPIQTAWARFIVSTDQVRIVLPGAPGPAFSDRDFHRSTIPMTTPPTRRALPMMNGLSRFFPITFVRRKAGRAVTKKASITRTAGWVDQGPSRRERKVRIRSRK